MDVRHEPFGEGKDGVLYWYLDLGPSNHASLTGKGILTVQGEVSDKVQGSTKPFDQAVIATDY